MRRMPALRRGLLAAVAFVLAGMVGVVAYAAPRTTAPRQVSGTIVVWDFVKQDQTPEGDALFSKKYPNVTVKHVLQPLAGYFQLVAASLAAHSGPDVIELSAGGALQPYIPALENLTSYIPRSLKNEISPSQWVMVSKNFDQSQGIYGAPLDKFGFVWWYNKKLFKQAGLDPSRPPSSWPELKAAAKKLKAAGITPFAGGDKTGNLGAIWFDALAGMTLKPKQAYQLGNGTLKFSSPVVKRVFQQYLQIANAGWFQDTWRTDINGVQAPAVFASGRAAMIVQGPGYFPVFNPALGYRNVGVFQTPGFTPGNKPNFLAFSAGLSYSVNKNSSNKNAAAAYALFKVSAEMEQLDMNRQGRLPTNNKVSPGPTAPPQVRQIVATQKSAKTIVPYLVALWPAAVQTAVYMNLPQVVGRRMSLDAALADIDAVYARLPKNP